MMPRSAKVLPSSTSIPLGFGPAPLLFDGAGDGERLPLDEPLPEASESEGDPDRDEPA
jgi:hypothetical protein